MDLNDLDWGWDEIDWEKVIIAAGIFEVVAFALALQLHHNGVF
jgi:hypothetical protein